MKLTKKIILDFLKTQKLMSVATHGDHPWIASVYYSFDNKLNLFFLSSPETIHVNHIYNNPKVAVSIVDSHQTIENPKKGLQIFGLARQISDSRKIKHALRSWKTALKTNDPIFTYENMIKKVLKGRMFQITPKKIKFFNQELFDIEDGKEPILEL